MQARVRRALSAGSALRSRTDGCWRGQGFPDRAFAFSADGIWQRPAFSRRVSDIDIGDPVWARLGFINEGRYNWNSRVSDVERAARDRRITAFLQQWRLRMPWFVMVRFPADYAGSALCWRGEVLWEEAGETFTPIRHDTMACRTLTAEDTGRRIFGVAIRNDPPFAMRLEPTATVRAWQLAAMALPLLGGAAVVLLLGALPAPPHHPAVHLHRASRWRSRCSTTRASSAACGRSIPATTGWSTTATPA